jgi:hypothetical protein
VYLDGPGEAEVGEFRKSILDQRFIEPVGVREICGDSVRLSCVGDGVGVSVLVLCFFTRLIM